MRLNGSVREMSSTNAEAVLREIESKPENRLIVGRRRGQILVRLAKEFQPKRILEIGTNLGYSAILMGKELSPRARITTIEINPDFAKQAEEHIRRAGLKAKVEVLVGDAHAILPTLKGEFELVFIDGQKAEYLDYLRLIEDKLFRGSIIVADNAGRRANEMESYLTHVRYSGKYESRFIPVGEDGVELSIKR
jgi:predicted O-methyltransferase YrrM